MNQMQTAYCPYCRIVTNLNESITLQNIPGPDGKTETIVTRTYHCQSCCSFVRSEDERKDERKLTSADQGMMIDELFLLRNS